MMPDTPSALPVCFFPIDLQSSSLPLSLVCVSPTSFVCTDVPVPAALAVVSSARIAQLPLLLASTDSTAVINGARYFIVHTPDTTKGLLRCDASASSLSHVVAVLNARCPVASPSAGAAACAPCPARSASAFGSVPRPLVRMCKLLSLTSTSTGPELSWEDASLTLKTLGEPSSHSNLFDVGAGVVVLSLLLLSWPQISSLLFQVLGYNVQSQVLHERVAWIMQSHAPLGFKLTPQVDTVLGTVVILIVDAWRIATSPAAPHAGGILFGLFLLAWGFDLAARGRVRGLSLVIALAADTVSVLVTHVALLHRIISRLLSMQLGLLGALGLVMTGKKRNVLRARVDTLKTDSAQLMLGTIVFALVAFTLQTTFAYHLLILRAWGLVFALQAALWAAHAGLATFPALQLWTAVWARPSYLAGHADPCRFVIVKRDDSRAFILSYPRSVSGVLADWAGDLWARWREMRRQSPGPAQVLFGTRDLPLPG